MKKRLKKKLSSKSKYELNELEELIILAHRINQTETGCVFIYDQPHVSQIELQIRAEKKDYNKRVNEIKFYYDEETPKYFIEKTKEFKEQLVNLLEELTAKKD